MQAIKSLNPNSARGVDGISAQELKVLPRLAVQHLMLLMNSYTRGFPPWLMWTRTFPVPKKSGPITAAQIRPISVMAQLYRLWSKIQCRHVLLCLHTRLPPAITGFLPGRGPYEAVYEMQASLERAFEHGHSLSGISIDLLKCFNTIDREGVQVAMTKLGIPPALIHQWYCSAQRISRSWILLGEVSPPTPTTRGCPEGDPLSVMAMITIALAWVTHVQQTTPAAQLSAYADNWAWMVSNPNMHSGVIRDTQNFVQGFTMEIDWDKSWIWMNQADQLPAVKRALRQQLGHDRLKHLLTAMDLGGQLTYRGPPKLGKVTNRFHEAMNRLKRLQRMPHDLRSKCLLIQQGIYPQVFYASAILPIGRKHTDALFAILWVCERFSNTVIHSDSTVALAAVQTCMSHDALTQDMEDLDLLVRLRAVLHVGWRTFHKVQAHAETDTDITWLTLFHRLGNKKANDSAILANQHLQPEFVADLQKMHEEVDRHKTKLLQLFGMHLQIIRRHADLKVIATQERRLQQPTADGPTRDDIFATFLAYTVDDPWHPPRCNMHELRHCTWAQRFCSGPQR